jgi:hypothetical protein
MIPNNCYLTNVHWQVVCGRRATKHRMQHLMSKMGLQPAIDVLSQHSSRGSTSVAYMEHLRVPNDTMKHLGACARLTQAHASTRKHARARTSTHKHAQARTSTHKHAQARTSTHKHTQAHTSTRKHAQAPKPRKFGCYSPTLVNNLPFPHQLSKDLLLLGSCTGLSIVVWGQWRQLFDPTSHGHASAPNKRLRRPSTVGVCTSHTLH